MTSSRLTQLIDHIYRRDAGAVKRAVQLLPRLVHCKHSKDDRTPLHVAAAVGCLTSLKELLAAGASCTAVDAAGDTPLHVAASQGHLPLVKELTADAGRRCCLKVVNKQGATPLHLAAAAGHTGVAQHLMSVGAKLQARDKAGRTPWELVHPEDDAMRACLGHTSTSTRLPSSSLISPAASGRSASRRSLAHLHHHQRGASPGAGSLASPVSSACSTPALAAKRGARPAAVAAAVRLSASNPFLTPEVSAAAAGVTGSGAPGGDGVDAVRQQDQEQVMGNGNPFRDPTPAPNPFHSVPFHGHPAAAAGDSGYLLRQHSAEEESMDEVPLSPRKRPTVAATAAAAGVAGMGMVNGHYVALTVAALEQHQRSLAVGHPHHLPPGAPAAVRPAPNQDALLAAPGAAAAGAAGAGAAPVVLPAHKPVVQNSPWADLGVRVSQCSRLPQGPLVSQGSYGALQRQELQQPLTAGSTALLRGPSFKGSPLAAAVDAGGLKSQHAAAGGPGSIGAGEPGVLVGSSSLARRSLLHTGSLGAATHPGGITNGGGGGGGSGGVKPYSIYTEPMPLREMSAKVLELEAAAAGTAAKVEQWDGAVEALPELEKSASELADRLSQQEVLGLQLEEAVEGLAGRLTDTEGALDTVKRRHEEATERVDGLQLSLLQRLALVGAEQQNLWSSVNHIKEQLGTLQEQQAATAASLAAAAAAPAPAATTAARSPSPAVLSPTGSLGGVRGAALGLEVAAAVAAAVRPLQEEVAALRGEVDVLMASRKAPSAEATALRTSFAHFSAATAAARGADSPDANPDGPPCGGGSGGVGDESLVSFMDTTSRCLMDQEAALAELQASTQAAERRSGVQLEELRQEVAVVQTALGLLGQSLGPGSSRPSQGPLSSAHNAASQMTMATNLVKIQTHMSQLETSFAGLQASHLEAAEERQALQAAWREEAAQQAAAAAAAADSQEQRDAEWVGREERLQQLRVAVLAEEAARRELLEVETGLAGAVQEALAGQEDLGRQVAGVRNQSAHMNEIFMCELHQINDKVDQVAQQLEAASAQVAGDMAALKAAQAPPAPLLLPVRAPSAEVRMATTRGSPSPAAALGGSGRSSAAGAARSPLPLPLPVTAGGAGRGSRPASRASPTLEGVTSVTSITSGTSGGGSSVQSGGQVLLPGRSQLSCALSSGPSSEAAGGPLGALPRPESREGLLLRPTWGNSSKAAGAAPSARRAGGQVGQDLPSSGDVGRPQALDQNALGAGDQRVTFGDTPVRASPSEASPAAGRLTASPPADYYLRGPAGLAHPGDGECDLAAASPGDRDAGQQKKGGYMRMTPSKSGGSASKWLSSMTPGRSSSKRKQAAREAAAAAAEEGEYVGLAAGGGAGTTRQVRPGDVPQCGCTVM